MASPKNTRRRSKSVSARPPGPKEDGDQPDYAVGFGKPPISSRFKPGHSGNPKGRPKGAMSMATIIRNEADQKITIQEGSKTRTVTKKAALFKATFHRALQKGGKDADTIFRLLERLEPHAGNELLASDDQSSNEADILDAFILRLKAETREELANAASGKAEGDKSHAPENSVHVTETSKEIHK